MDRTDLRNIPFMKEQCDFVCNFYTEPASNVLKWIDGEKYSWNLKDMVIFDEVASTGLRGRS